MSSLHLVGAGDTVDIQHMVGRTAGFFGSGSGIYRFQGGYKLPRLALPLIKSVENLHLAASVRAEVIPTVQRPMRFAETDFINKPDFVRVQHSARENNNRNVIQRISSQDAWLRWGDG